MFAELKRRNVIRMAGLYLVGAWMITQVAETVLPVFAVPDWVLRAIMIVLALGFVPALIFAWVFELTPEGIKRDHEVDRSRSIAPRTGQRMNIMIATLLSLGLAWYVLDKFVFSPTRDAVDVAARLKAIAPAVDSAPTIDTRSIAVLPFENLSEEKANAYFADGIQDQILTGLSRISELKVISRTSTLKYASAPDNVAKIAAELGVAHILEGSVQKAGNQVRINVQLIKADGDSHLWAETYDRTLEDIFAVQSEVAEKIARSLRATLTQAERSTLSTRPTANSKAYAVYLRARALQGQGNELGMSRDRAQAYAEAVQLDPDFALAWAALANLGSYLYHNGVDPEIYTAEYVKQAVDTALRLQPHLTEAKLALGLYQYRVLWDLKAAAQSLQTVLDQEPNRPDALALLGYVERRQGRWEQAAQHLIQAAERDPANAGILVSVGGETLSAMRRYDEAEAWLDRALAVVPDSSLAVAFKAFNDMSQGQLDEAEQTIDSVPSVKVDPFVAFARSRLRLLQHRYDLAIEELQPLLAKPDNELNGFGAALAISLAQAQEFTGKELEARKTYQRLVALTQPNAEKVDDTLQPMMLALAYSGLGRGKDALAQAKRAVELYQDDAMFLPNAELTLAQIQAKHGDHDAAISGLSKSIEAIGGMTKGDLRFDQIWDPLREDPRFQALLNSQHEKATDSARE